MKPRIQTPARISLPLASAIAALLATKTIQAASGTWTANASSNWTTATNWSGSTIADGTDFTANFTGVNITADRTVTLAADRTIGNITFTDLTTPSHNLIISGPNILTLDLSSGVPVIDVTQSGRTLTISSVIAGDGLQKNGAGNLLLQGANTYTGATIVNNGILTIQNYSALDTTSGITVAGGSSILSIAVVGSGATSDTINKSLSLNGTLRTAGGTGSNTLALTWNGNITLAGNSTINNHGNGSIDVNGQVDLATNTLTFQTDQAGSRIDGKVIGSGGLTKTGAQLLTITGANTYTGVTNISTGTLSLGSTGALGGTTPGTDGTSNITMGNGSTLRSSIHGVVTNAPIGITTAATISTNIAGSGTAVRSFILGGAITGTGNVTFVSDNGSNSYSVTTLNAASSYVGNTTINASVGNTMSIVRLGIDNALPTATQLTITGTDTTAGRFSGLDLRGFSQEIAGLTGGVTTNRTLQITNSLSTTPTGTLTINTPISTSFTFAGRIGNGAASTLGGSNFNLEKKGAGTQILTGTNDFAGFTKVSGGILGLGNALALRSSALDTTNSVAGDATNGLSTTVTTLTFGGLNGNKNFSDVFTTTGGYNGLTALTFNPGTGVTNSYSADIGDGAIGMTLTKTGAGTQTLTGTNTHTGSTTVSAGVLAVNGSLANTSTTTVSGTGTLKGSGSIASDVTVGLGGTLASGTSIESLAVGGNLSFTTGSSFEYELNKDAAANEAGDLTAVTGSLSLAGTVTLNLVETGVGSWELGSPLGDHLLGSPAADKLTLISYNGTWNGGLFTYLGNLLLDDSSILINGQLWFFNYNDTDAGINYTGDLGSATRFVTLTVPEPNVAALLGGLGMLALIRRRR